MSEWSPSHETAYDPRLTELVELCRGAIEQAPLLYGRIVFSGTVNFTDGSHPSLQCIEGEAGTEDQEGVLELAHYGIGYFELHEPPVVNGPDAPGTYGIRDSVTYLPNGGYVGVQEIYNNFVDLSRKPVCVAALYLPPTDGATGESPKPSLDARIIVKDDQVIHAAMSGISSADKETEASCFVMFSNKALVRQILLGDFASTVMLEQQLGQLRGQVSPESGYDSVDVDILLALLGAIGLQVKDDRTNNGVRTERIERLVSFARFMAGGPSWS